MTSIPDFDYIGVLPNTRYTSYLDVSEFTNIKSLLFVNANTQVTYDWSSDKGINTDYVDTVNLVAGVAKAHSQTVRARYLRLWYGISVANTTLRCTHLFHSTPEGLASLSNAGAGVELYKSGERSIRTLVSTDSSVVITELTDEVNLQVSTVLAPITLTSAGGTTLVNDGAGPDIAIKGITAGAGIILTNGVTALTVTNSAPDQTVVLTAGANVAITGAYPNFTIASSGLGGINSYGYLRMSTNAWTGYSFSYTTSFQELLPTGATYIPTLDSNFTNPSNARLQYIGATTRVFSIRSLLKIEDGDMEYALYKNGVLVSGTETPVRQDATGFIETIQTVVQNDSFAVWGRRAAAGARGVYSMTFMFESLT